MKRDAAMLKMLVINPAPDTTQTLAELLSAQPDWEAATAASITQGLDALADQTFAMVIADLQLVVEDDTAHLKALTIGDAYRPVLLTGADGTVDQVVNALNAGAAGFIHQNRLGNELVDHVTRVLNAAQRNKTQARLLECMTSSTSQFAVENDPTLLPALLVRFQTSVGMFGVCDEADSTRIGMALEEALSNALYHGNLEVSSELRKESLARYYDMAADRREQSPYRERKIHITETMTTDSATFVIRDEGPGFDTAKLDVEPDPDDLEALSGRGLMLMRAFMDEVIYNDRGNQVTLVKHKSGNDGEGLTLAA
ncbi:MAG: ATP-binding protein [Planctomycetota bacterium]